MINSINFHSCIFNNIATLKISYLKSKLLKLIKLEFFRFGTLKTFKKCSFGRLFTICRAFLNQAQGKQKFEKIFIKLRLKNLTNFLIIFILSVSCKSNYTPSYILSNSPVIQKFEEEDNFSCNLIKLNSNNPEIYGNELYWRCRLSYAKYRLKSLSDPLHQEVSVLIAKIDAILYDSKNSSLQEELSFLDKKDHKTCVDLGFISETLDKKEIENYFLCRERLIQKNSDLAPFNKNEYLKFINRTYNIGYVVNKNIADNIEKESKKRVNYPECSFFSIYSDEFKECTAKHDKIADCKKNIEDKKAEMKHDSSLICQKQAYERFGNNLLKNDSILKQEIARKNYLSDYQNRTNFDGLGIDEEIFSKVVSQKELKNPNNDILPNNQKQIQGNSNKNSSSPKTNDSKESLTKITKKSKNKKTQISTSSLIAAKDLDWFQNKENEEITEIIDNSTKKEDQKKLIKDSLNQAQNQINNTKNSLYTRYEIAVLRQKYIASCQKLISIKIKRIEETLIKECESSY